MTQHVSDAAVVPVFAPAHELERQVVAILWVLEEEAYLHADGLLNQALAMTPEDHPYRVTLLKRCGKLYREQGRFGESARVYQEAIALSERLLGVVHDATRRVRWKFCQLQDRMRYRSGLGAEEQAEHVRVAEECYQSARERALADGKLGEAAVLLSDRAAWLHSVYQRSHHRESAGYHKRAEELSRQAVEELIAHRHTLPPSLNDEPGRAAAALGRLFADNYALKPALEELRLAVRLLGHNHPWYKGLRWEIRELDYQLHGDEYDMPAPRYHDTW